MKSQNSSVLLGQPNGSRLHRNRRPIGRLHSIEKPREKLAQRGASFLEDEELLAILLRTGYKNKDVLTLSRNLLKEYSGRRLFEIPFKTLSKMKGLGTTRAATIQAAWELSRRILEVRDHRPKIRTVQDVCEQVGELRDKRKEHFVVLYLDTRNQLLLKESISLGTVNASLVHPREVYEPAIRVSAVSLILVHNHPSGDASPSKEDREVTRQLQMAGEIMGIDILDHVIISPRGHFSFEEKGLLLEG